MATFWFLQRAVSLLWAGLCHQRFRPVAAFSPPV